MKQINKAALGMGLLCQGSMCSPVIEKIGLVDVILSNQGVISMHSFSGQWRFSHLSPLCYGSSKQPSWTHAIATAAKTAILQGLNAMSFRRITAICESFPSIACYFPCDR